VWYLSTTALEVIVSIIADLFVVQQQVDELRAVDAVGGDLGFVESCFVTMLIN
jgi:hypothetical protein